MHHEVLVLQLPSHVLHARIPLGEDLLEVRVLPPVWSDGDAAQVLILLKNHSAVKAMPTKSSAYNNACIQGILHAAPSVQFV